MGAEFHQENYDGKLSHKELHQAFDQRLENLRFEVGHGGYSGTWVENSGLRILNKEFETVRKAVEYLADHAEKSREVLAVKALAVSSRSIKFPATKTDESLQKRQHELKAKLDDFDKNIVGRARRAKSKLKSCEKCGSRIATTHIRSIRCPVCGEVFLLTATDLKNKGSLQSRLAELSQKIQDRKKVLTQKAVSSAKKSEKTVWVLGAWCRS